MNVGAAQLNGMHETTPDLDSLCLDVAAQVQQCFDIGQSFANQMDEMKRLKQWLNINSTQPVEKLAPYQHHFTQLQQQATNYVHKLLQLREQLFVQLGHVTSILDRQVQEAIGFQTNWLTHLKWAQIGAPFEEKDHQLKCLQEWFSKLAANILHLRSQMIQSEANLRRTILPNTVQGNTELQINNLNVMLQNLTAIFLNLVSHSLIIVKQPEPIINVNKKIKVHLRLLLAKHLVEQKLSTANVRLHLVPEEEAERIQKGQSQVKQFRDTAIVNSVENFKVTEDGYLEYHFDESKISKIPNRRVKNGVVHQQAAEQKYAFVFTVVPLNGDVKVPIGEILVQLMTISLPFAVSVHHKQEHSIEMQAMMFWERAFGDVTRQNPTPLTVTWQDLAPALVSKMHQFTGVAVPLTAKQMDFIFKKIGQPADAITYKQLMSSSSATRLPTVGDKTMEFFVWYFAILDTIFKMKLQKFWDEGWLAGFATRAEVEEEVRNFPEPACMLRFSDSMPGAVSIAFITNRKTSGGQKPEVKHLNPLLPKDIEYQSLARRLTTSPDLKHITTVLTGRHDTPSLPKDDLIPQVAAEPATTLTQKTLSNGYTQHVTVMMISDGMQEGYNNNSSIESQMPLSPFAIEQEFPAFSPLDQHSVDLIQLLLDSSDIDKMLDDITFTGEMDDMTMDSYDGTAV